MSYEMRFATAYVAIVLSILYGDGVAQEPAVSKTARVVPRDAHSFLFMIDSETNVVRTFGVASGKWHEHRLDSGIRVMPVYHASNNDEPAYAAFTLTGERITELVAIDTNGEIQVQKLDKAANGPLTPIVRHSGLVAFVVDGYVYAFSAKTGTWDRIEAPKLEKIRIVGDHVEPPEGLTMLEQAIIFENANMLAAFSVATGKWSELTTEEK